MKFQKYQGTGNDFIIINSLNSDPKLKKEEVIAMCDRNFGIGADGILSLLPSKKADYKMKIFNSDGSIAQMCGNGIRCFAAYIYNNGFKVDQNISIETDAGVKKCKLNIENREIVDIEVDMGVVSFEDKTLFNGEIIDKNLENNKFTAVSVGNPHMVIFNEKKSPFSIDFIKQKGEIYGKHKDFIEGTNVEFANIVDDKTIELTVFERGCGITLACGTGACATVSAAIKLDKMEFDKYIDVKLPGGNLKIFVEKNYKNVKLKGEAKYVFKGEY